MLDYLGDERYALYYEEKPSDPAEPKPLKLIYSDGTRSGASDQTDFDDWEGHETARDVDFLWPDGTLLDAEHEAGLGDHVIVRPRNNPTARFRYANIGGQDGPEGMGSAEGNTVALGFLCGGDGRVVPGRKRVW